MVGPFSKLSFHLISDHFRGDAIEKSVLRSALISVSTGSREKEKERETIDEVVAGRLLDGV